MMTNESYRESHLGADQLNAFIEGALSEHERQQSLAHLAECQQCRQIVFLAQQAETPEPARVADVLPSRPWFASFWLVGGALACAVLLVAVLHLRHAPSRTTPSETATLNKPQVSAGNLSQISPGAVVTQEEFNGLPESPKILPPPKVPAARKKEPSSQASAMDVTSDEATVGQESSSVTSLPLVNRSISPMASPQPAAAPAASYALANGAVVGRMPPPAPSDFAIGQEKRLAQSTTSARAPLSAAATMGGSGQAAAPAQPSNQQLALQMARETNTFSEARGSVTDQSGAVVPGATVTLRQLSGTASGQAVTNASGQFVIASLQPGRYELQIASPGFQTMTRKFDLGVHDLAQLDSKLTVGSTSQTVEVAASTMEVTNATSGVSYAAVVPEGHAKGSPQPLPSKLPAAITLENGGRTLAVDSAGALFVSKKAGARWKAVKHQWPGKIAALTVAPVDANKAKRSDTGSATAASTFQLTTESGAIWLSTDGVHWSAR